MFLRLGHWWLIGASGSGLTHRLLSSSFLGLPYRILNLNHRKELLGGLWVKSNRFEGNSTQRVQRRLCRRASLGRPGAVFSVRPLAPTIPIGSMVVPFCGAYLGPYKVIPKGTTREPMGAPSTLKLRTLRATHFPSSVYCLTASGKYWRRSEDGRRSRKGFWEGWDP